MIRFPDPGDPSHVRAEERLRTQATAWLTTVSPTGQPQSTPVWFVWNGSTFLVFSRQDAAKLRNIAANPHVSVHLDGDGHGGDSVIFEGTAEADPSHAPADAMPDYVEKYSERIEAMGLTPETLAAGYPAAIRITPTRVRVW
jgi:PPOX class probable F420-dependent enzyme